MGCGPSRGQGDTRPPDFKLILAQAALEGTEEDERPKVTDEWYESLRRDVLPHHPLSPESIAKHNSMADLWIIVDGFAVNCTKWQHEHPAGPMSILRFGGKDATADFQRIHSSMAKEMIKKFRIGRVAKLLETPSTTAGTASAGAMTAATNGTAVGGASSSALASGFAEYVVLNTEKLSHNTVSITFASPTRLRLTPGGHMNVQVPTTGAVRPYTPYRVDDTSFTVMVKKYDGGACSPYMHSLRPGDRATLRGPIEPYATLPATADAIVLIAGGTGIAPMYSIALAAVAGQRVRSVVLVGCYRAQDEMLLHAECAALAKRAAGSSVQMHYYLVFSRAAAPPTIGGADACFAGRLASEHLAAVQPPPGTGTTAALVCGPSAFNFATEQLLQKMGVQANRIWML